MDLLYVHSKGLHPRVIAEGYDLAKDKVLEFLEAFKVARPEIFGDRELLSNVARTSLRTKLSEEVRLSIRREKRNHPIHDIFP